MGLNDTLVVAIRKATFGRQTREPIAKSLERTQSSANNKLDTLVNDSNYRIRSVTTEAIPSEENYFTLIATRANGT